MSNEKTDAKCPFNPAAGSGTSNRDWWPNQLRLDVLRVPEAVKSLGSVSGTHVEVRGTCEICMRRARKASHSGSPSRKGGKGARGARHE
jgi:hypothetical protein